VLLFDKFKLKIKPYPDRIWPRKRLRPPVSRALSSSSENCKRSCKDPIIGTNDDRYQGQIVFSLSSIGVLALNMIISLTAPTTEYAFHRLDSHQHREITAVHKRQEQ